MKEFLYNFGYYVLAPVLTGICVYLMHRYEEWKKCKKKYSLETLSKKNQDIHSLLTELRVKLNADRAYLSQFHNGNKFVNKSDILKKTRTNESVRAGVSYEASKYHEIHTSLLSDEMEFIESPEPIFLITNNLEEGRFKRLLLDGGAKSVGRFKVSSGNDIIGFIGVDFCDSEGKPKNFEEEMNTYSGYIEQILWMYK